MKFIILNLLVMGLLAGKVQAAPEDPVRLNSALGKNDCRALIENYERINIKIEIPEKEKCLAIGVAVTEISSGYPYWFGCLDHGEMPDAIHVVRCVALSEAVRRDPGVAWYNRNCPEIRATYERGLKAARPDGSLPPNYTEISCETLKLAGAYQKGGRQDWLRCRGYTPDNQKAHAALCLMGVKNLHDMTNCGKLREHYVKRLFAAYGTYPKNYRGLRCSQVQEIVERAKKARAELRSRAQAMAAMRRAERERRRNQPLFTKENMHALMVGGIILTKIASEKAREYAGVADAYGRILAGEAIASFNGVGISDVNDARELAGQITDKAVQRARSGYEVLRVEPPKLSAGEQAQFVDDKSLSIGEVAVVQGVEPHDLGLR